MGKYINLNGLTNGTIKQIAKFQEGLERISDRTSMEVIYAYVEKNQKLNGIPEEIYEQLDTLKNCEAQAILYELKAMGYDDTNNDYKELPEFYQRIIESKKLDRASILNIPPQVANNRLDNVLSAFIWVPKKEIERFSSKSSLTSNKEINRLEKNTGENTGDEYDEI